LSALLGFDCAGTVHSLGSAVPKNAFKAGEEVWLLGSTVPTHSNAEYVLVDYRVLAPKPKSLNFSDAAAIPLVGLTAWELLIEQLKVGEEPGAILIINGAGGVGSIATQLARNVSGLKHVIATASRETRYVKSLSNKPTLTVVFI
jgi:NADPH2:quinone reductase